MKFSLPNEGTQNVKILGVCSLAAFSFGLRSSLVQLGKIRHIVSLFIFKPDSLVFLVFEQLLLLDDFFASFVEDLD